MRAALQFQPRAALEAGGRECSIREVLAA